MSNSTSRLSLYKPESSENVNVVTDLNNNLDLLDLNMNFRTCTSITRPSVVWDGLTIHETDTNRSYLWNATPASSGWYEIFTAAGPLTTLNLSAATSATYDFTSTISGESNPRVRLRGDGILEWGSGSATPDSNLYRGAANTLKTDDSLIVAGTTTIESTTDSTALAVSGGGTFSKSLTVGGAAHLAGGIGVLNVRNATTAPTAGDSTGNIIYSDTGQLKNISPAGAIRSINGMYGLSVSNTVSNSTTETDIVVMTIPANDAVIGATYRIVAWGICSNTSTPTVQWRTLLGTNAIGSTGTLTCASGATSRPWRLQADLVCLGSSSWAGNMWVSHTCNTTTAASATTPDVKMDGNSTVSNAISSTNDFKLTFKWSAASGSNILICRGYHAERVA